MASAIGVSVWTTNSRARSAPDKLQLTADKGQSCHRTAAAEFYSTGTTGGAPLSLTKNTKNLAGWVSLAFLETA